LKYVDPAVRYPPGWAYDGKEDYQISNATIQETWQAMESLVEKNLTKSIGISNFQGSLILDLLRYAKIRPAVLQIEHHPYLVQKNLLRLAKDEGIAVTAYSTFGPSSFLELGWQKAYDTPLLFDHPTVTAIAKNHEKTSAQVILRWVTQRGLAIIPKSNTQDRLEQNLHVTDFDLTDSELEEISGLDRNLRFNNPTDVRVHWCPGTSTANLNILVSQHSPHLRLDGHVDRIYLHIHTYNDKLHIPHPLLDHGFS